ncbi:hypothetical protein [Prevotellamassilia timonensis]|uniref:hypothetical protein n=1 Tax=Prevotellamassilia timonensis TaxID=1852370 RepID=UPI00307ADB8B
MFLNIIGSGTGNRFSPQTHDDERDKEGTHSKTLNLLKLEILNNFTDAKCLLEVAFELLFKDKTLVSSSKLLIFASVTVSSFSIVNQLFVTY